MNTITVHLPIMAPSTKAVTVELTPELREAIASWVANECYLANGGNFRMKGTNAIPSWNRAVKTAFGSDASQVLHHAAKELTLQALKESVA